jgi:hypothetical protein
MQWNRIINTVCSLALLSACGPDDRPSQVSDEVEVALEDMFFVAVPDRNFQVELIDVDFDADGVELAVVVGEEELALHVDFAGNVDVYSVAGRLLSSLRNSDGVAELLLPDGSTAVVEPGERFDHAVLLDEGGEQEAVLVLEGRVLSHLMTSARARIDGVQPRLWPILLYVAMHCVHVHVSGEDGHVKWDASWDCD